MKEKWIKTKKIKILAVIMVLILICIPDIKCLLGEKMPYKDVTVKEVHLKTVTYKERKGRYGRRGKGGTYISAIIINTPDGKNYKVKRPNQGMTKLLKSIKEGKKVRLYYLPVSKKIMRVEEYISPEQRFLTENVSVEVRKLHIIIGKTTLADLKSEGYAYEWEEGVNPMKLLEARDKLDPVICIYKDKVMYGRVGLANQSDQTIDLEESTISSYLAEDEWLQEAIYEDVIVNKHFTSKSTLEEIDAYFNRNYVHPGPNSFLREPTCYYEIGDMRYWFRFQNNKCTKLKVEQVIPFIPRVIK